MAIYVEKAGLGAYAARQEPTTLASPSRWKSSRSAIERRMMECLPFRSFSSTEAIVKKCGFSRLSCY